MEEITRPSLKDHLDVLATVASYMSRKVKYSYSLLNKDFRNVIVPRSMVSLSFKGRGCLTDGGLFTRCVSTCKKVEKLEFREVTIDLPYANSLFTTL